MRSIDKHMIVKRKEKNFVTKAMKKKNKKAIRTFVPPTIASVHDRETRLRQIETLVNKLTGHNDDKKGQK